MAKTLVGWVVDDYQFLSLKSVTTPPLADTRYRRRNKNYQFSRKFWYFRKPGTGKKWYRTIPNTCVVIFIVDFFLKTK